MPHPLHDHRYQQIATLLAQLRKERGWLQQEVAERLGRNQTFVSKYESGARRIDLIELLDILRALEVDPHEFVDQIQSQLATALPR
ncbi:helix-turn-helix domain-containing protein [Variovorax terrae]|uniref:Helix-turn-helix domain-containing protein n=1 Tax=Variovorax terrae TaxID=2923278 RepID=A0A9X1VYT3_9BURK|nr:helix-turn-helix transcriptional regulator [Variovorax terrae]MCJ0765369.1 helix-turn-helix domain-containing protein [Variovorax terrae]